MAPAISAPQKDPKRMAAAGLKAAYSILDKWGCSAEQGQAILALPRSSFFKYRNAPESASLGRDQLERLSYLVNIHAHLRTIFDNPENVYGFMSMKNDNPFFDGAAPLDIISSGSFASLYETAKRIDALRGGQW